MTAFFGVIQKQCRNQLSTRTTSKIMRKLLIGITVLVVLILTAIALLLHRPSWFDSRLIPQRDAHQRGSELETAIIRELTRVRPGKEGTQNERASDQTINQSKDLPESSEKPTPGTTYVSEVWAVSIMESDINAWLSGRLPAWLQSREVSMPVAFNNLCVRLDDNAAYIAAEYTGPPLVILTQPVTLEITPTGDLSIRFSSISSGLLPLPGLNLTSLLPRDLISSLLGNPPPRDAANGSVNDIHISNATIRLEDGRTVRILDLKIKTGRFEVTCQTEK